MCFCNTTQLYNCTDRHADNSYILRSLVYLCLQEYHRVIIYYKCPQNLRFNLNFSNLPGGHAPDPLVLVCMFCTLWEYISQLAPHQQW